MVNGIQINKNEFLRLPTKQQNLILFENTESIKKLIKGYKFELWTHRVAIFILFVFTGFGKYLEVI